MAEPAVVQGAEDQKFVRRALDALTGKMTLPEITVGEAPPVPDTVTPPPVHAAEDHRIAFIYAHGGPVLQKGTPDGLNERGRNLVKSVHFAVAAGADRVFISESVKHGEPSHVQELVARGFFSDILPLVDIAPYTIAAHVKFPKNYLMNRGAQRAEGFFGLVFSDSDAKYNPGFTDRVRKLLRRYDFGQPEKVVYTVPDGGDGAASMEMTAKIYHDNPSKSLYYPPGMPGFVNIAKRTAFLGVGGFSQAISGVNFEDMEYHIRLKILKHDLGLIKGEIVRHIFHERSRIARQAENLPTMWFENTNFMNWLVDHYLQILETKYNAEHFERYLHIVRQALHDNPHAGTYSHETGDMVRSLGFNPDERYTGYLFGWTEPYSEDFSGASTEEQIAAIHNASHFWRVSPEQILQLNNPQWKYPSIHPDQLKARPAPQPPTQPFPEPPVPMPDIHRVMARVRERVGTGAHAPRGQDSDLVMEKVRERVGTAERPRAGEDIDRVMARVRERLRKR